MPKTVDGLWADVVSWDNLIAAYRAARRNKRFKPAVMRFHRHWEEELLNIHNHLIWGSWQPGPFRVFEVFEPKQRTIEAPPFRDRIVHHALHRIVEPHFERRFIHHSYACRRGRGTHAAVHTVQQMLRKAQARWGRVHVLQGDIAKYFPSIDQRLLFEQIKRVIADERVLQLWQRIIETQGVNGVGLPIGAHTSQISANIHMDPFDHHMTDDLGHGFYVRYLDDWILLGPDKQALWQLLRYSADWLQQHRRLAINPKSTVYPASQGIDFAGYRTWATHILPRKRNVKRARRRVKAVARRMAAGQASATDLQCAQASFNGYLKYCQSQRTRECMERQISGILETNRCRDAIPPASA